MQPGFDGVEKVPFKGEEPGPCMERGMGSLAQCPFALSLKSPSAPNSSPQPQEPPQAPTLTPTPPYQLHPHSPPSPHCIHAMFVLRKWQSMHREGSGLMFLLQAQAFKRCKLKSVDSTLWNSQKKTSFIRICLEEIYLRCRSRN